MSNVFSRETLEKFEDASASIPLRRLERAFGAADVRLGDDPGGGLGGHRRTQFRRYVATIDQRDPPQRDRLSHALGALIAEVAASKEDFLVKAAESDGFSFVDGAFRPAETAPRSFAVTRPEELASIDDRGRRLRLLVNDRPQDAIAGAKELLESVCRTVLRLLRKRAPEKTAGLFDIVESTLEALAPGPVRVGDAQQGAGLADEWLAQLGAAISRLGELRDVSGSRARLAIGATVTLAGFVAESYHERAASIR